MCSAIVFKPVTRARFDCLQLAASGQVGIAVEGDSGSSGNSDGSIRIAWDYVEAAETLTLQCTQSPYPCFLVASKLKSFVASCP